MTSALNGVKVLDLSLILAGPTCTQLLRDLGADVIKIENPASAGDDTRAWGQPYATDASGQETDLSAYFNYANRNKRSVAIDIATPEGQKKRGTLFARPILFLKTSNQVVLANTGLIILA